MAVFPCDFVPHRYTGSQRSIYTTVASHDTTQTNKLRLCVSHFEKVGEAIASHLAVVDESAQLGNLCDGCGQNRTTSIFCTLYDQGEEPSPWAGDFCDACTTRVLADLLWTHGRPR